MAGPEGYNPSDPHNAEAYPTPSKYEGFITPEGYDVSKVEGAEAYLTEVHGFTLPEAGGDTDKGTGYHLALALQTERRAAMYEDGEHQNVAEHSAKLSITTVWTALKERPDLDAGKVSIMAGFHDLIEAYSKDTVINDEEALKSKHWREKAAMTLVRRDLGDSPLVEILEEYENLGSPEARFVNAMDKVEAYQFALNTKAALQRGRAEDFRDVAGIALPKAVIDPTAFRLMKNVLKNLGRKWHGWGCMPFDGNPDEIIDMLADEIASQHEAKLAAYKGIRAVVRQFTGTTLAPAGLEQPKLNEAEARQKGVTLLASRRGHNRPTPPMPPTSPAFGVALI
jgi:5'-deoxynucleotidase YfbR-like HD superfamily hydrolase